MPVRVLLFPVWTLLSAPFLTSFPVRDRVRRLTSRLAWRNFQDWRQDEFHGGRLGSANICPAIHLPTSRIALRQCGHKTG